MIERLIDTVVSDWSGEIEKEIVVLIAEWEAKIEDDDTLYTLGARRALDILRGEERTLNS
jgi:calcineurin-like phosphoesterase family protein